MGVKLSPQLNLEPGCGGAKTGRGTEFLKKVCFPGKVSVVETHLFIHSKYIFDKSDSCHSVLDISCQNQDESR